MKTMTMIDVLTLTGALGCGLMAGFFFAFSVCVMQALGKLPAAHGVAAMQNINVVVINPRFLTVFMGTAALCVIATIAALLNRNDPATPYLIAGGVLYVVGTFIVTMRFNVPLNNALAAVTSDSAEAARLWSNYLSTWTHWNHVRTAAALAAAAAFSLALRATAP
jgi:uncharacterized membrane protein